MQALRFQAFGFIAQYINKAQFGCFCIQNRAGNELYLQETAERQLILPLLFNSIGSTYMRADLQNNKYCRFRPYSSDNLFRNPPSERLARRRVDPKTESDNHIEVVVFDNVSASITHYTLLHFHLAFIRFASRKHFLDMPFYTCRRCMEYRRNFFDGHPYYSVRR